MLRIFYIICLMMLAGCQSINNRGIFVETDYVLALEKAHATKEKVVEVLGAPTIIPNFSQDTWYYMSRTVQDKIWSRPEIKEQRIVKLVFVGDKLDKAEISDKLPTKYFSAETDYTESKGTEESVIQTFVKNFGRFNKLNRKQRR